MLIDALKSIRSGLGNQTNKVARARIKQSARLL